MATSGYDKETCPVQVLFATSENVTDVYSGKISYMCNT